jgi:hypothetical protein
VRKKCSKCGKVKNSTSFNKAPSKKHGINSYCKECNKAYQKEHYKNNKKYYCNKSKAGRDRYYDKVHKFLRDYFSKHSCVDCGESDIRVLEFDHVKGEKLNAIATLMAKSRPLKIIELEIEKCEVRCANCHCKRTRTNSWRCK